MITTRRNILNYYIKPYINILLFGSTLIFFVFNIVTKGLEFNSFQDFKILFYFFVLVFLCYYSILSNKQNIMSHFVFLNWLRLLSIERIDELFIRQQKILITYLSDSKNFYANYFVHLTFGLGSQIIYLYWFNKFANLRFNYEDFQSAKTKLWTSSPWEWFILKFIPVTFVRHPGVVEGSRVLMVKKSRTSPFHYQKQYARLGIKY
jgi:hypothetical protein